MNQRKCLKCGHATTYDAVPPSECEKCGAIYRKVEEAFKSSGHPPPDSMAARTPRARRKSFQAFAETMRSESLYPTWREIVKFVTLLGYLVAVALLLGAVFAFSQGGIGAGIGLVFGALVVAVFSRVWKELSLMVADLADAAVRHAATAEANNPTN